MRAKAALAFLAAAAVALSGCFGAPPNAPPVVTAKASAGTVAVGDEVIFTGTAVDTDGSVVNFAWDFETDGNIDFLNSSRGAATHRFALPGLYTATFTAEDDKGLRASATVNVTVVARFTFNADWGNETGFLVHGAPTLLASALVVTVSPTGAAAPTVFRSGEGLTALNNTTYRVALQGLQLQRYGSIRVEVAYNGTASGFRVFRPVPFHAAENDTANIYAATINDVRNFGGANTTLSVTGQLTAETTPSHAVQRFEGSATSTTRSEEGGAFENGTYELAWLAWNHSISATEGTFATTDYAWSGTGNLTSETPSGAPVAIRYTEYRGTRLSGALTSLWTNGTGSFGRSSSNSTYGSVNVTSEGNTSFLATDGQGTSRLALRVVENRTYDGLLLGAPYFENNVSETLYAASDSFMNTALFEAWNSSGYAGATSLASTGSRFIDSDGDGTFNPDPRPVIPYDGQFFVGLAPGELEEGDAFTVHNGLGSTVRLEAAALRTEVLAAAGFTTAPVDVVSVSGNVSGAGLTGQMLIDLVASGPHNMLRLREQLQLFADTGSFSKQLVLSAKGVPGA